MAGSKTNTEKKERHRGNLLVTGGLGYIGSITIADIITRYSLSDFKRIIIIDNNQNSSRNTIHRIRTFTGADEKLLTFEHCNLSDECAVLEVFEELGPFEAVLHLAGSSHKRDKAKPLLYYDKDVKATRILLRVMGRFKV